MYRRAGLLFCEEEHGCGEVTFPNLNSMDDVELTELFIVGINEAMTRKAAKAAGWTRVNKADYCPGCSEAMKEGAPE